MGMGSASRCPAILLKRLSPLTSPAASPSSASCRDRSGRRAWYRINSFDDFVGSSEDRGGQCKAKLIRGFEIYHHLQLWREFNGQVRGGSAVQNLAHVSRD